MTIKILLADDHHIFREGLKSLIKKESDMTVTAEARTGKEAVQKALALKPSIIIMDINMPEMNGIQATEQILAKRPDTGIIALSIYAETYYVNGMLKAGVKGYLLKNCAYEELINAIREVALGRGYLSSQITGTVLAGYTQTLRQCKKTGLFSTLTAREKEVLCLIARGRQTQQIADSLFVSPKTVSTHRRHIMEKLDIHSVAGLTKAAIQAGLILLDD